MTKARIDIVQEVSFANLAGQLVTLGEPVKVRVYSETHEFGKDDNVTITIPQIPRARFEEAQQ